MKVFAKEGFFVDSSAWIALYDRDDQYHQRASQFLKTYKGRPVTYHTSDYIIDESITHLRYTVGLEASIKLWDSLFSSPVILIHAIDSALRDSAWKIFCQYSAINFSFTDATSFALMQNLRIRKAFTFDHHFSVLGFEIFPR
ncbi:PIN domain-containing protein [candidate division KSB1 bacterium]|nr:PIN domain-containing protein [candidate division KSB1 bacterium]